MHLILVTGFEPFGGHAENPSGALARALGGRPDVAAEVLPVAYASAGERVRARIEAARPRAVLVLGLAAGARSLRLERVARNCDDTASVDNDGVCRRGASIRSDGPDSYASSLPLAEFERALARCGQVVEWSDDAGGFLCNHVFYAVRDALCAAGRHDCPAGLVHVPETRMVPFDAQLAALEACLELLR